MDDLSKLLMPSSTEQKAKIEAYRQGKAGTTRLSNEDQIRYASLTSLHLDELELSMVPGFLPIVQPLPTRPILCSIQLSLSHQKQAHHLPKALPRELRPPT
jgi:hypothetical protein